MLLVMWERWEGYEQFRSGEVPVLLKLNEIHRSIESMAVVPNGSADQTANCIPCVLLVEVGTNYGGIVGSRKHTD